MMKEQVFENPLEPCTVVPEPHFDDQRTVLAARPVVSLEEIRTKLRYRRLLVLGGAFALAIMLGAMSALLAVHLKQADAARSAGVLQQSNSADSEVAADEAKASAAVAVDEALVNDSPDSAGGSLLESAEDQAPKPVVPKKQSTMAQRPRTVARDSGQPTRALERSEDDELERIREAVLFDQWQERRMRRAARRERRNRGDRDLSHVDEIFEGPRRPERP